MPVHTEMEPVEIQNLFGVASARALEQAEPDQKHSNVLARAIFFMWTMNCSCLCYEESNYTKQD